MSSSVALRFRAGDQPGDEDFFIEGVEEILALEGTFVWTEAEATKSRCVRHAWHSMADSPARLIWRRLLGQGRAVIADDAQGQRAGFVLWEVGTRVPYMAPEHAADWGEPFAWVAQTRVSPSHRRLGIGKALYAEARRAARAQGVRQMQLDVYENNASSVAFHTALGFVNYATLFRIAAASQADADDDSDDEFSFRDAAGDGDAALLLEGLRAVWAGEGAGRAPVTAAHAAALLPVARVVLDAHGVALAVFVAHVSDQHAFGVSYGSYEYAYVHIDYVFCAAAARRRGVGRAIVRQLRRDARARRVPYVLAGVQMRNAEAVAWLGATGFAPYVRVFEWPIE